MHALLLSGSTVLGKITLRPVTDDEIEIARDIIRGCPTRGAFVRRAQKARSRHLMRVHVDLDVDIAEHAEWREDAFRRLCAAGFVPHIGDINSGPVVRGLWGAPTE